MRVFHNLPHFDLFASQSDAQTSTTALEAR